jgi:hypothetical protein
MRRRAIGFLAGLALVWPLRVAGDALHLGGAGFLLTLVTVMFFVSLFDRDYFYGEREPD